MPRASRQRAFGSHSPAPIIKGAEILCSRPELFFPISPHCKRTPFSDLKVHLLPSLMLKLGRSEQILGSSRCFERKFKKAQKSMSAQLL